VKVGTGRTDDRDAAAQQARHAVFIRWRIVRATAAIDPSTYVHSVHDQQEVGNGDDVLFLRGALCGARFDELR
jgi:hypothetical protein